MRQRAIDQQDLPFFIVPLALEARPEFGRISAAVCPVTAMASLLQQLRWVLSLAMPQSAREQRCVTNWQRSKYAYWRDTFSQHLAAVRFACLGTGSTANKRLGHDNFQSALKDTWTARDIRARLRAIAGPFKRPCGGRLKDEQDQQASCVQITMDVHFSDESSEESGGLHALPLAARWALASIMDMSFSSQTHNYSFSSFEILPIR